ncbi:DegT/DnrJ/EryC1/StrS family aminotransferase [Micromonospora sp. NPDC051141]|uniref:DegT/DnrJ/EryC1/StrS family aminotransferase n=1 Tax=Micromonospora sp. NPDC051141 TaxID=3364284 RepID=UPI0037883313
MNRQSHLTDAVKVIENGPDIEGDRAVEPLPAGSDTTRVHKSLHPRRTSVPAPSPSPLPDAAGTSTDRPPGGTTLALFGGTRAVPPGIPGGTWPIVTADDEQAVLRVLRSGKLNAATPGEPEIGRLERAWADATATRHCVAVASGTAALELVLRACGIGPDHTVVVPALTMNATAHAVHTVGGTAVFADVDPETYTMDPRSAASAAGPRTAALLPVHLHGLPADMPALNQLAARLGVPVVEDAAQAHGAQLDGRRVGALGTAGCFSLHPHKNLPTCGEGGLVTTGDDALHEQLVRLRNFGERTPSGARTYIAHQVASNSRMAPLAAAFTLSQLTRFADNARRREPAIRHFLDRLAQLPGLRVPVVPPGRTHAWHILRLMPEPDDLGLSPRYRAALRAVLHRVLRAEGVPVSQYQVVPLPAHPAFRPAELPESTVLAQVAERFPVTVAVVEGSLCLQRRHLDPAAAPLLQRYADAFEKTWEHLDVIRRMTRSHPAPDWRQVLRRD